jgi:hypothetical protein
MATDSALGDDDVYRQSAAHHIASSPPPGCEMRLLSSRPCAVQKVVAKMLSQNRGDGQLDRVIMHGQVGRSMLPATLQFIIAMIAYSINERLQRKLDYVQVEVQVLKEALRAATGTQRINFTAQHRRRLAVAVRLCDMHAFMPASWRATHAAATPAEESPAVQT